MSAASPLHLATSGRLLFEPPVCYNKPMVMDVILAMFPTKDFQDTFLGWLRGLDIDKEEKKRILMMWCDRVDVKVTGAMVKRAGID